MSLFRLLLGLILVCSSASTLASAPLREWNFLVFINGVNNLDDFGALNINQMEEVGSNEHINLLVQWGSLSRPSVDRLRIEADQDPQNVTSPILQSLGPADMGDWRQLVDFARWAQQNFPAKKTFLVVWNHGSGWHRPDSIGIQDISSDDRTGNKITTEQLGQALSEIAGLLGKKVDLYGSDACLMGMVEVAAEMADSVDYFLGSQDLEPGEGWPYSTFLRRWSQDWAQGPRDVARILAEEFFASYNGGLYGQNSVTMSAWDLSKLPSFQQNLIALSRELKAQLFLSPAAVRESAQTAKGFFEPDYRDLLDFLNLMEAQGLQFPSATSLRSAHQELIYVNLQNQDNSTHGLSIWLPTDSFSYGNHHPRYRGLRWARDTGWTDFLEQLQEPSEPAQTRLDLISPHGRDFFLR